MSDNAPNGNRSGRETARTPEDARPGSIDHMERARKRIAEIRAVQGDGDDSDIYVDKWYAQAPPGWTYEWKTYTVWNKEYPQYYNALLRNGWSPVPSSRHRDLVWPGYAEEAVIIDGMILMERPKELTDRQRRRDLVKAIDQVRNSEAKLAEAPPGTAPRNVNPRTFPNLSAHVGPVVPD